jgi:hypothetical protein
MGEFRRTGSDGGDGRPARWLLGARALAPTASDGQRERVSHLKLVVVRPSSGMQAPGIQ